MPHAPRSLRLVAGLSVTAVAAVWACTDPTGPRDGGDRYYRLDASYTSADAILHVDGTYLIAGGTCFLSGGDGRWRQAGDSLLFSRPNGVPDSGRVAGDTLYLVGQVCHGRGDDGRTLFRFLRTPFPESSVANTRWVLRAVNGAAASGESGFLLAEFQYGDSRRVERIVSDTLVFADRVFFHEARVAVDSFYPTSGGAPGAFPLASGTYTGGYTVTNAQVVQRYASARTFDADTLTIIGSTLVRRYAVAYGSTQRVEERYERIP